MCVDVKVSGFINCMCGCWVGVGGRFIGATLELLLSISAGNVIYILDLRGFRIREVKIHQTLEFWNEIVVSDKMRIQINEGWISGVLLYLER